MWHKCRRLTQRLKSRAIAAQEEKILTNWFAPACTLCSYGRKEDEVEVVLLCVCQCVRGTGMAWAATSPHLGTCRDKISMSFKLYLDVPQRLGVFQVISQQKKFEIYFQHTGVYGVLSMHWTGTQALPVRTCSLWTTFTSGDASSPSVA